MAEALLRVLSRGAHMQDGGLPREAGSEPGSRHAQGNVHHRAGREKTAEKPAGKSKSGKNV